MVVQSGRRSSSFEKVKKKNIFLLIVSLTTTTINGTYKGSESSVCLIRDFRSETKVSNRNRKILGIFVCCHLDCAIYGHIEIFRDAGVCSRRPHEQMLHLLYLSTAVTLGFISIPEPLFTLVSAATYLNAKTIQR